MAKVIALKKDKIAPFRTIADDIFGHSTRKKGINSKVKGNKAELDACKLLSAWAGVSFNRVPNSGGLGWVKDARISGDIVAPVDFDFPFSIEVKYYEDLGIPTKLKAGLIKKFWEQAVKDSLPINKIPLLLVKQNGSEFYMFTDDLYFTGLLVELKIGLKYKEKDIQVLRMYKLSTVIETITFEDFKKIFVDIHKKSLSL